MRRDDDHFWVGSRGDPVVPRKASTSGQAPPVPETDTGGQVEYTEACELIVVKELGKMPP